MHKLLKLLVLGITSLLLVSYTPTFVNGVSGVWTSEGQNIIGLNASAIQTDTLSAHPCRSGLSICDDIVTMLNSEPSKIITEHNKFSQSYTKELTDDLALLTDYQLVGKKEKMV